ncbi:PREDICTED: uncharacterized protein LOC105955367 [Erythranthe guttata]|uniref:uncharacterized protein LOC105955367 n=1 Tax=Erythranthe guttata TaxID=4155 RepID=UPI00064DF35F|nr:PREDICTED: uncharacterized protein LOC105955367 [Erythranthe guttata]|eukprot:XP_012834538.1 PREDICTED: uncharacterized protein LOC105955367 [Erythranthe guttata]
MNHKAGPSHYISSQSSSSSSSTNESDPEDSSNEFDIQTRNTNYIWNYTIQQQQMMQQYYLSQSQDHVTWGGAIDGHAYTDRGREAGAVLLKNDYFGENPTYDTQFRRRFRMIRDLFQRIRRALKEHSTSWKKSYDSTGRQSFTSYQKMCASIQFLGYGTSADSFDQYFRIAQSTLIRFVKKICRHIVKVFGEIYLRNPNSEHIEKLLQVAESRGFPGMLGSLDCMHWEWKNCPTAHAGAYRGRNKKCTIILEAVASHDTWIWHAFFGLPGTNNDVNVLQKSTLFQALTNGTSIPVNYSIKGRNYDVGYYLADGIYPKWSTLVQSIRVPKCAKETYFVQKHESYRKDVERAFGVLQARFAIIRGAARFWNKKDLHDVMFACIIMHNMIVEEERSGYLNVILDYESSPTVPLAELSRDINNTKYVSFLGRHRNLINQGEHNELRRRLVAHLWDKRDQLDGVEDDDDNNGE